MKPNMMQQSMHLETTKELGAKHIKLLTYSKLLANLLEGSCVVRCDRMISYLDILRWLASHFDSISIT